MRWNQDDLLIEYGVLLAIIAIVLFVATTLLDVFIQLVRGL